MVPGSGPGPYQHDDGWPVTPGAPRSTPPDPNQQPGYTVPPTHPEGFYPPPPSYDPTGYPTTGYPPPGYEQPAYQQPGYYEQGYPPPGYYEQQGYHQAPPVYGPPPGPVPGPVPPAPAAPAPRSNQGMLIGVVAAVAIVAILSVVAVSVFVIKGSGSRNDPGPSPSGTVPGGRQAVGDPGDGLTVGSGPVDVDVYVDYQCPPCSTFESATADLVDGYLAAQRVTFTIHPVAFIDNRSKNRYSTRAAAAVVCAYQEGKVLEFHKYLLEHQPDEDTAGPTDDELVRAGGTLGLGQGFRTCVSGQQQVGWVREATSAASDDDVDTVPALFVEGTKVNASRQSLDTAVANA